MGEQRLSDHELAVPQSTVQIEGRSDGPPIITVTVHAADVAEAARLAREQYDDLIGRYAPSSNGRHAAPVVAIHDASDAMVLTATEAPARPALVARVPRINVAGARSRLAALVDRDTVILGISGALLSVLTWWLLYWYGSQPVAWDARGYYDLALVLTRVGLANWGDPLRTYAYPLFLAGFLTAMEDNPTNIHQAVSLVQLAVHLVMAALAGWAVSLAWGKRWPGLLTYFLIVLSPVLLIQATELLTDSLSASAIGLAVIPLVVSWRRDLPTGQLIGLMVVSLFCAALSAAIRPANAIIIVAVVGLWVVRAALLRTPSWRWVPLLAVVLAVPLLPQSLSNYRAYKTPHPLIVTSLYESQIDFGAQMIKYGTNLVPGKPNQLRYDNPFLPPGAQTASDLMKASPLGYVATLGLHAFALLDQDQPFTYVFDLHPWYRWYLAVGIYLFWCVAGVGTTWAVWRVVKTRTIEPMTWAVVAPALVGAAYIGVYLPSAVEVRYGAPLFLLAAPAAAIGLGQIVCSVRADRRRIVAWAAGAAVIVVACASLSAWITQQAPSLRG
jgi:hypothetical protein